MDFSAVEQCGKDLLLRDIKYFDLDNTLDCGQSFRWQKTGDNCYTGIAHSRVLVLSLQGNDLVLHDVTQDEFENIWRDYFDLSRDYTALFGLFRGDEALARALDFAPGIRVLRQDAFEALCSFIISQNNNITRIKGIIARLCATFGEPLGGAAYAFPTAEALVNATEEQLREIGCGYRTAYILAAARQVFNGELKLEPLYTMPPKQASDTLCAVHGIGKKVAACVLLYGFGRVDFIPEDVWVKRIMSQLYPNGFPSELAEWGGIAQQTLFHYARRCEGAVEKT